MSIVLLMQIDPAVRSFRRFAAWQAARRLTLAVYSETRRWPVGERFGLTSQVQRAAVSVMANIAEGTGRRGSAEFARFLGIAFGSLAELDCLLELARDLGHLEDHRWEHLESLRTEAARLTWRLLAAVRRAST